MRLEPSKLYAPPLHADTVGRRRLRSRLEGRRPGAVILVLAPAGYGKSTLAAQWLAEAAGEKAWLTLDPLDADPARLGRHLAAALAAFVPGASHVAAAIDAGELREPRAIAEALVAELRGRGAPASLVVDDAHALGDASGGHALLAALAERLPETLALTVTSRATPPWPLARMRARGRLEELDAEALRFSADEARALFEGRGLPTGDAPKLAERTEGWAAGLVLSALLLRKGEATEPLGATLRGTHGPIADYLVSEVLAAEPEPVREFLLESAALPFVDDALAEAAGLGALGVRVADLAARGLFVTPLDPEGRRYRYHALFRELLEGRALGAMPDRVDAVRVGAARALDASGEADAAVALFLSARAYDDAAAIVERASRPRLLAGEFSPVRRRLEAIPEDVRARRPLLLTLDAWTLPDGDRARYAEPKLDLAEALLARAEGEDRGRSGAAHAALGLATGAARDRVDAEIAMMRSFFARMRLDFDGATRLSRRALELAGEEGIPVRARAATGLGQDAFMRGEAAVAHERFEHALSTALHEADVVSAIIALGYLVELLHEAGELDRAVRAGHRFERWLDERRLMAARVTAWRRGVLVGVLVERNLLDRAAEALEPLLSLEYGAPLQHVAVQGRRFTLAVARGDLDEADRAVDALDTTFRDSNTRYSFGWPSVAALRADLALRRGDHARALAFREALGAESAAIGSYLEEGDQEIAARIDAVAGDARRGAELALALAERAAASGRARRAVVTRLVAAYALTRLGDESAAVSLLDAALRDADSRGFHRSLFDALPDPGPLLDLALARGLSPTLTRRLVATTRHAGATSPVAVEGLDTPLRPRELQVLRLLGDGLTNDELAARLGIRPTTIKVHLRRLYAKLGTRNRAQTLARARELGLG